VPVLLPPLLRGVHETVRRLHIHVKYFLVARLRVELLTKRSYFRIPTVKGLLVDLGVRTSSERAALISRKRMLLLVVELSVNGQLCGAVGALTIQFAHRAGIYKAFPIAIPQVFLLVGFSNAQTLL